MPKRSKPKEPLRPFDQLTREQRAKWRALPETRAFRAHLAALIAEAHEQIMVDAEKGNPVASTVGYVRGFERVIRELLVDPAVRQMAEEETFVDPADITEELTQ